MLLHIQSWGNPVLLKQWGVLHCPSSARDRCNFLVQEKNHLQFQKISATNPWKSVAGLLASIGGPFVAEIVVTVRVAVRCTPVMRDGAILP